MLAADGSISVIMPTSIDSRLTKQYNKSRSARICIRMSWIDVLSAVVFMMRLNYQGMTPVKACCAFEMAVAMNRIKITGNNRYFVLVIYVIGRLDEIHMNSDPKAGIGINISME